MRGGERPGVYGGVRRHWDGQPLLDARDLVEVRGPVTSTHRGATVAAVHGEQGAARILQLLGEFERVVELV